MPTLYGILELDPNDRTFIRQLGQRVVWDAGAEYISQLNDEINAAQAVFVEETTTEYSRRYKLPGGGYMQEKGKFTRAGGIYTTGGWDIQLPIQDFADVVASDEIDLAYMTVADMERTMETVSTRSKNTKRLQILQALFNNDNWYFNDTTGKGTLTIKPLANGDTDKYPPVHAADSEASENHFLASGYAASAISDTNNPCATIKDELEEHFGGPTVGGSEIVIWGAKAHTQKIEELPEFVSVNDMHIDPGANAAEVLGLPEGLPGVVKGRGDGWWYVEWQRLPTNYLLGLHLEAPKPLLRRIDEAGTGLGDGNLQLLPGIIDEYPFQGSMLRRRDGLGVGNRLNGCVMFLDAGSTYVVPTAFTR